MSSGRPVKRILIANGILSPDGGGPANYSEILGRELPKRGVDITIVTYSDDNDSFEINSDYNYKLYSVCRRRFILWRYFKYFWQVFKLAATVDLIYIQGPVSEGLPASLAARLRGRKFLLKIVGDYAWEQGRQRFGVGEFLDDFQKKKYGLRVELMRFIQKMVARKAKKIIVPSRYLKTIVSQWEIKIDKIKVVYNSAKKIRISDYSQAKVKEELGLSGDVILSISRLVPWKGFDALIEIMPELLEVNPRFILVIGGGGPDKEKLQNKIDQMNLSKQIRLTGNLPQGDVWRYMAASEIFVLNTAYEGLSHLIIEAMHFNRPVVTTPVGGNIELIRNNENGLLVEYNNKEEIESALIKFWRDKELAHRLSAVAKEDADNKFSQERMIDGVVEVFNSLS